jgi:hypothetical protein
MERDHATSLRHGADLAFQPTRSDTDRSVAMVVCQIRCFFRPADCCVRLRGSNACLIHAVFSLIDAYGLDPQSLALFGGVSAPCEPV